MGSARAGSEPIDIGSYFHNNVWYQLDDGTTAAQGRMYHLQRTARRMMEEATELCLACGCPPGDILTAVVDNLANEARKKNVYPSQLGGLYQTQDIAEEVADVRILVDYVRYLARLGPSATERKIWDKIQTLAIRAEKGELHIVDGAIYKKVSKQGVA